MQLPLCRLKRKDIMSFAIQREEEQEQVQTQEEEKMVEEVVVEEEVDEKQDKTADSAPDILWRRTSQQDSTSSTDWQGRCEVRQRGAAAV